MTWRARSSTWPRSSAARAGPPLAAFFTPDAVQDEFPNRVLPHGARRDLRAILDAAARGREVMAAQRYDLLRAVVSGHEVVLEVLWSGTLAVSFGPRAAGSEMRARLAIFLEFREGRIVRQRNYDCYEPW
jgi:ketosteroid isomerase-like protein